MRITLFHPIVAAFVLLLSGLAPVHGIEIERSPADTRDYRAIMLDNGLEALLVSDPAADRAAAALDVNVGSADDPDARPGLAHFLEHMLFLGTVEYPDPGEYGRFLAEHGGSGNATTSFAHTSYFFDIDAAHLEGALDRFAQFFVSPRFDRESIERERQVVHSEYVSRRRSDRLRSFAAWKQALDPRHPLSRFLVGNATTLADRPGADVRDELIDFYESHYSAHLMKLAVVGREPPRRAGGPGAGAVLRGTAPQARAAAHHPAAVPGRTAAGAARRRADPRAAHHLALVRDPAVAPALPGAPARARLPPPRPRRPREPALGAEGTRLGRGPERGAGHGASGLRYVRDHHPGHRGGGRAGRGGGRLGVRLPRPHPPGGDRAAPSRGDRAHGADRFPLSREGRRPLSREVAGAPPHCMSIRCTRS